MTRAEMEEQLETFIDERSLDSVINALYNICRNKAEHVRANWDCEPIAKRWDDAAHQLDKIHIYI